jgi:hypothetical protein
MYCLVHLDKTYVVGISNTSNSIQFTISVIYYYNFYHNFDTADVTASDCTYLQYENIHITFVNGNNARTVVMARPKSSLYMYTSTNMPIIVLKLHIITITI